MPYRIVKSDKCPASKPFAVINTQTGKQHGCHETKESATSQMRLLYGIESGSIKK